jgi:AraC-like DNA-binding protein
LTKHAKESKNQPYVITKGRLIMSHHRSDISSAVNEFYRNSKICRKKIDQTYLNEKINFISDHLELLSPKDISHTLLAFVKTGYRPDENLMQQFEKVIQRKLQGFNEKDLSQTLWVFAEIGYQPDENLMQQFEKTTERRLKEFNEQDLSQTLGSFSKIGYHPHEKLMKKFEESVAQKLSRFNTRDLSQTISAFAEIGYQPSDSLMRAFKKAVNNSKHFLEGKTLRKIYTDITKLENSSSANQNPIQRHIATP